MEWIESKEAIRDFLKKYKAAIFVVAVGILLLTIPTAEEKEVPMAAVQTRETEQTDLEKKLEQLLSQMEGAGKVRVLLTEAKGKEIIFQKDETASRNGDSANSKAETVVITDQSRNQSGLIRRTDPPAYLGAVVLCQGADRATVRLAIVDAIATATGLSSDKISVWKMK